MFSKVPTDKIYIRVDYTITILVIKPNFGKLSLDGLPDKTDSIQQQKTEKNAKVVFSVFRKIHYLN